MAMILNFIAFQLGWFACVLGGAYHMPWVGTAVALTIVALHVGLSANARGELILVTIAGLLGGVWDSALVMLGWIGYPSGVLIANTAPLWIVALWMVFATTLNMSLRWLQPLPMTAAAFGAVAGPLAYVAGQKLGGVDLVAPAPALFALGMGWALFTPLLLKTARRLRATGAPVSASTGGTATGALDV